MIQLKGTLIDHYSSDFIFCFSVDYDTRYTEIYDLFNYFFPPSNWSPKTKRNIRLTIQLTPQIGFCCKTTYLSMKKRAWIPFICKIIDNCTLQGFLGVKHFCKIDFWICHSFLQAKENLLISETEKFLTQFWIMSDIACPQLTYESTALLCSNLKNYF